MTTPPSFFIPRTYIVPPQGSRIVRENSGDSYHRDVEASIRPEPSNVFSPHHQYPTPVPVTFHPPVLKVPTMPIAARSAFDFFTKYQRQLINSTIRKKLDNTPSKVVDENDERDEDEDEEDVPLLDKKSKSETDSNERTNAKKEHGHDTIPRNEKELMEIIQKRWEEVCPATKAFFHLEAYKDLGRFKKEMDEYHLALLNSNGEKSALSGLTRPNQQPATIVNENGFGQERPDHSTSTSLSTPSTNPSNISSNKGNKKRSIGSVGTVTPRGNAASRIKVDNKLPQSREKEKKSDNTGTKKGDMVVENCNGIGVENGNGEEVVTDYSLYGYYRPFYEIAPILNEKPSWYRTKEHLPGGALGSIP